MYIFPFKTIELQKLNNLFGKCDCIDCIKNINNVPIFTYPPENQNTIYYGVSVKDLYEFTNLESKVPLPWNLPSRYNS